MKLSLDLIKEHLQNAHSIAFFRSSSDRFDLNRPVLYDGKGVLKSDTLYICSPKELAGTIQVEKGAACICGGMPEEKVKMRLKRLIVTESCPVHVLFNQVQEIFLRFDQWENELLLAGYSNSPRAILRHMLDVSSDIFDNGLSVMDNAFRIIMQNETNVRFSGYVYPDPVPEDSAVPEDFAIPEEMISYYKYDKEYQVISESRDVFYYESSVLPHRVLCRNIFQNDQFLFRIIITECIRPFRRSDEYLLTLLSDHFFRSIRKMQLQDGWIHDSFSRLILDMITSGQMNRQAIESELRSRHWTNSDTYRIATLHVSTDDLLISTLSYYAREAGSLLPQVLAIPVEDVILLVINESRSGPITQYSGAISLFVRENNFRMGISNFSDDFYNIRTLFRQAEMALNIGLTEKPMEWIHWFSQYTMQYIYNRLASDTEVSQLLSPLYYQLQRYDKENASSYLQTLQVYLECHMNTVRAAKELYIQRSTMIYRLKRIREITGCDLKNRDDLLHLFLTFSILDREARREER